MNYPDGKYININGVATEYTTDDQKIGQAVGMTFGATGRFPLIHRRIWSKLQDAQEFVDDIRKDSTACAGLVLVVINDGANNGVYYVASIGDGTNPGVLVKLSSNSDTQNVQTEINNILSQLGTQSGDTAITNYVSGDTFSATTVVNMLDNLSNGLDKAVTGVTYDSATNKLKVTHLSGDTELQMTGINLISGVTYDKTTEKLTITYVKMGETTGSTVDIDLTDLIHETSGASGVTSETIEVEGQGNLNVIKGVVDSTVTDQYLKVGASGFYTSGITEDLALKQDKVLGADFVTTTYPTEFSAGTPIATADTVISAFTKVEHTISALTAEVLDNELVTEEALKRLNQSGGYNDNGEYEAPNTYYISASTDVTDALEKLGVALHSVEADTESRVSEVKDDGNAIDVTNAGTVYTVKLNIDPTSNSILTQSADGLKLGDTWDCGTYDD